MNQKTKKLAYWASVIVIGAVVGISLQFVKAWTEPTAPAPGGNVGAPINTTGSTQTKTGALGVNGIFSVGRTSQDYVPAGENWHYTMLLNSVDTTSIGFHDAMQNVGSIRFKNNLFTIGADDGWGVANTSIAGALDTSGVTRLSLGDYGSTNGVSIGDDQYKVYSIGGSIYMNSSVGNTILQPGSGNVGIGTSSPNDSKGSGYLTVKDVYIQDAGKWASELGGTSTSSGPVSGQLYGTCSRTVHSASYPWCSSGASCTSSSPASCSASKDCQCPSGYTVAVIVSATTLSSASCATTNVSAVCKAN